MVVSTVSYRPLKTRQRLVAAAFDEIWQGGFRAASLDRILDKAGVTKGALYHHFKNKLDLGYAVLDEVVRKMVLDAWVKPLHEAGDPIETLHQIIRNANATFLGKRIQFGCPLNNLSQEMSSVDEGFRLRIKAIVQEWTDAITVALAKGQNQGLVRENINLHHAAIFIITVIQGAAGMGKNARDQSVLIPCLEGLGYYLDALRPRCFFRDGTSKKPATGRGSGISI